MREPIGTKLRQLRMELGWTQEEVIARLRGRFPTSKPISLSTLNKWERGATRKMAAGDLANLVVLYGADWEDVFSLTVSRPDAAGRAAALRAGPADVHPLDAARRDAQHDTRSAKRSKRRDPR